MILSPYPEIKIVMYRLLAEVRAILDEQFVGLYLVGSLACGDYDPQRSDIDFVCVTKTALQEHILPRLKAIHAEITACGLPAAMKLEGAYIPLAALRRYDPAQAWYPSLNVDGHFSLDGQGVDGVIQRYILREHGLPLAGPHPRTLVDPVSPEELKRSTRQTLREWWAPQVGDPFRLESRDYQAYAVLTMCRALYTIQSGDIVSKPFAARWAIKALDEGWRPLIERALRWKEGDGVQDALETVEMIRWTIKKGIGESANLRLSTRRERGQGIREKNPSCKLSCP